MDYFNFFSKKINDLIAAVLKNRPSGPGNMADSWSVTIATDQTPIPVELDEPIAIDPPVLAAGEAHIGQVGGTTSYVGVDFTRPSNTDAYAAKDVIGNTGAAANLTFTNIARINQGSGYITKVRIMTNQAANAARFRLHLFHTAPTPIADNAQYTLSWSNRANRIGSIDLDAQSTEGTGSDASTSLNKDIRLEYHCTSGSRTLYGILETLDAFTPTSAGLFYVEIAAENN